MLSSSKPNLFSYATSELSQDAFICWLVAWINHPNNKELNSCAKEFVCRLYNLNKNAEIRAEAVGQLLHLERQYYKIDVYFMVEIHGKKVSFVIEDKVHTSHHSNQLERYKEVVEKDNLMEDEFVFVYYKTGYLFDTDLNVKSAGYSIFDLKAMNDLLTNYEISDSIYADYKSYIQSTFSVYESSLKSFSGDIEGYNHFKNDFIQWEFMKELKNVCPECINDSSLYKGQNIGGNPWTQYRFVKETLIGKIDDFIFYRIDKRKNRTTNDEYYLSVRHYAVVKQLETNIRQIKVQKVQHLIDIYKHVLQSIPHTVVFSDINKDFSGANESEIAILFFNSGENTVKNVLTELPALHIEFVKKLRTNQNDVNEGIIRL